MIRNIKMLGLTLVAVLAMSTMAASAAGAANFTASNGAGTNITATNTGNFRFKITNTTVSCPTAIFSGTAPAASFSSITVSAAFSGCTSFGTAMVTGFGAGGCDFLLNADGTADLNCPAGKDVTIDAGSCVVHIPAQSNLGTLTYTNNGGHVDIVFNLAKVTANHTDGFLCPFGSSGNSSEGELESPAGWPVTAVPSAGTLSFDP